MEKIVMGTSLAPCDFEKQIACLKTWINSGFEVLSFNNKKDIELLKPYFEEIGVIFHEINRDASEVAGKPVPYINDILCEVSKRTDRICGYFNADIIMHGVSEPLYEFIRNETINSLVYIRRNEISKDEDILRLNWKIHFDGIDVFFIDKKFANLFYEDYFFVQSAWDLFILEKCKIKGIKVKELMNPVAFHKRHAIKWDFDMSNSFAEEFEKRYYGTSKNAYERALIRYYQNLWEYVEKVSFCDNIEKRCLFVIEDKDAETLESVRMQEYPSVSVASNDLQKAQYDYVFYLKKKTILDKVFCKTAIFIMEQFALDELELGAFFVSCIEGCWSYNNLNRNMNVVYQINDECGLSIDIHRNCTEANGKGTLCYPISYKEIDINRNDIINYIKLRGRAYVMPAGVRGSEWYKINRNKLKDIEVVGYVDNSVNKIGTQIMGKRVFPVEQICKEDRAAQVIVASKYYSNEIKQQLLKLIDGARIWDVGYIVWLDSDGGAFFLNMEKYKL